MGANMSPAMKDKYRLCKVEKHSDLNFRAVELVRLPKKLAKLTWLTKINFSENLLEEVPDEISVFKRLQHLDVSSNNIRVVSPLISELTELKWLNLRANFLEELPEVNGIKNLEFFDVSSNSIKALPQSLFDVAYNTLRELHWAGNNIVSLPSKIASFAGLRVLDLANNTLTGIDNVYQITSLEEVNISGNQIAAISSACGLLINLRKLNCDSNPLTTVDDALFINCVKLTELNLGNGKLSELSPHVGKLQNLQLLDLQHNQLQELPRTIGLLGALVNLNLSNNRLVSIPWEIGYLHQTIRKLNLGYNFLETLPGEIGYLNPGCDLSIAGNKLKMPFVEFIDEILNLLRTAKPHCRAFAPLCTFDRARALEHVRANSMNELTVQTVDFMGTRRCRGGDLVTAFAVLRTPENVTAARGLYAIGDAVHPLNADPGTAELLICKDLGDGTYSVFFNLSNVGVYDLWIRVDELVFGDCPCTLIVE